MPVSPPPPGPPPDELCKGKPPQGRPSDKLCPNCSTEMTLYTLAGHYRGIVDIDICMPCGAIWFDQMESSMLSADGTVALFQLIEARGGTGTANKFGEGLRCVHCGNGMRFTQDRVRGTRFNYQACRRGHGRLTTFHNFLAEKQFVRELTRAEREHLAVTVRQIRCSGCGAPVDIGTNDACPYCRAPISVFDREAATKAIDHYLIEREKPPAILPDAAQVFGSSRFEDGGMGSDILHALARAAKHDSFTGSRGALFTTAPATAGNSAIVDLVGAGIGSLLESLFD